MEFITQYAGFLALGANIIIDIILIIYFMIKKKKATTKEEKEMLDEIIATIIPTAISGIKKLCEEHGIKYNTKIAYKETKKYIKGGDNNGEQNKDKS